MDSSPRDGRSIIGREAVHPSDSAIDVNRSDQFTRRHAVTVTTIVKHTGSTVERDRIDS